MTPKHEVKLIPINLLVVNPKNPRFNPVESEPEAILKIVKDQADKLINLASDIINEGLNPSDLPIVTPLIEEGGEGDRFLTQEGNRRVATLKLLNAPTLADKASKTFQKKLKPLADKYLAKINYIFFTNVVKHVV